MRQIPDLSGLADEVIIQRSHRFTYDHAVRSTGVRLVEVETAVEMEAAIGPRTAMLLFLNLARDRGAIGPDEFVAIARRRKVPTLIDCAADVPPVDTLRIALRRGFRPGRGVGRKGDRRAAERWPVARAGGPVEAAAANSGPNADAIGRGMKVTKETRLAMYVALEQFLERDTEADWREWEQRIEVLCARLATIPGVRTERYVPPIANHAPHLSVRWDATKIPMDRAQVAQRLRDGEPSIEVVPEFPGVHAWAENGPADALNIGVWTLQPGESEIVAGRLADILTGNADG